jgi:hypothetical protein
MTKMAVSHGAGVFQLPAKASRSRVIRAIVTEAAISVRPCGAIPHHRRFA